ncbi:MAG: hypothetical protein ACTSP1_15530 [Candidatus Freyarchaeota archaeon]
MDFNGFGGISILIVIDACALEDFLKKGDNLRKIKNGEIIIALSRPKLLREYGNRIREMRSRGEELGRIVPVLGDLIRSAPLWVDDEVEHNFDCVKAIPRKDLHLFVAAKEAALHENVEEAWVVTSARDVREVEECENGRVKIRVAPI